MSFISGGHEDQNDGDGHEVSFTLARRRTRPRTPYPQRGLERLELFVIVSETEDERHGLLADALERAASRDSEDSGPGEPARHINRWTTGSGN